MPMKTQQAFLLALVFAAGSPAAHAQETLFAAVDYMHLSERSTERDYLDMERLWQRIHQKAVDEGRCRGWYVYRIENDSRHQFATVRIYDKPAYLFEPWSAPLPTLIKDLYTEDEARIMNRTEGIRSLTRTEIWGLEATASKSPMETADYLVIGYMKVMPGKLDAYYQTEKDIFRKAHQIRVDAGDMKYWLFLSRWFPSGTDSEYDYLTVNGYADKAASEKPWDMDKISKAMTKEEMEKGQAMFSLRTMVRSEIWRPVLKTTPARR